MKIDLDIIAEIESSNNPKAFNKVSGARGLCQITPICLKEWNNFHPYLKYTLENLFDKKINRVIADWYLNVRIPQMLLNYKMPISHESVLSCYNFGIGAYKMYLMNKRPLPEETQEYIKKYKTIEDRKLFE